MTIDYQKLAWLLTPTFLRRPVMMAVGSVVAHPLQRLHDLHSRRSVERMYRLAHTSQTCHIKAALNKEFDIDDYREGFRIEDIDSPGRWNAAWDERPEFAARHLVAEDDAPKVAAWDETEMYATAAFRIIMPAQVEWNEHNTARITSVANAYRLASRTFVIQK